MKTTRHSRRATWRFLIATIWLAASLGTGAQFVEVDPGIAQPPFPCVAIADYDNDGDLDILVAGVGKRDVPFTTIYKNSAGVFIDSGVVLPGLSRATAAWGDFDGDGDMDLAMTGLNSSGAPTARIYRNDGGTFVQLAAALAPVFAGNVTWADYDNDGDLDLLVTGITSASAAGVAVTRLYRNDGGGAFVSVAHPFPDCYLGAANWGDYDNDGRLDLLLTGATTGGGLTGALWHNDGGGNFSKADFALPAMDLGFAVWGDFDNDGDLDLLFGGNADVGFVTTIYRNDNGTFTDSHPGMLPVLWASAAWGDYDNDGDLDAMIIGYDPEAKTSRSILYRNDNGIFSDSGNTFHNLYLGTVQWIDYDNDGKIDLLMAGNETGLGDILRLAHNTTAAADTPPTAPTNLAVTFQGKSVTCSWSAGSDAQTPALGLSYSLRVGTTPGGSEIVAPQSAGDGYRRVADLGNAQLGLTARVEGLTPGRAYYWSVQSIDGAFVGSPFASESSFVMPGAAQSNAVTRDSQGAVRTVWIGTPGLTYRLEASPDLVTWSSLSAATAASESGILEFSETNTPPGEQFYRVVFP